MSDSERIYRQRLAEALEAAQRGEGELATLYKRVSGRIQTRVRKRGENVTVFELKREVDAAFEAEFAKRVDAVTKAVGKGGAKGAIGARETLEKATRAKVAARVNARPETLYSASRRIAERTQARAVVPVSERIRRWDSELGSEMAREIDRGIKQSKGILGAARKIQSLDTGLEVRLPGYLAEVENAARAGNLDELKVLTKGYAARVKRTLGEIQPDGTLKASAYSLRGPTTRFLRDIEKARGPAIDGVVKRYVEDRAQYQARLIARHETVEAFRESYVRETRDKPGVAGYQWRLSGRHKVPDECDVFANQNAYDLGPGVYPADGLPRRHPACTCALYAVTSRELASTGQAPRDTSSPKADEWLKQNQQLGQQILGPTRWAAFKEGVPVLDADGRPRLVREIGFAHKSRTPVVRTAVTSTGTALPPPVRAAARVSRPPPKPKEPPKPALPNLPEYGKEAEGYSALRARYTELRAKAFNEMTPAGLRYAGDIPEELVAHVRAVSADVESSLGIKQRAEIKTVTALLESDPHGDTAMGTLNAISGEMKLRISDRDSSFRAFGTIVHESIHAMGGAMGHSYRGTAAFLEEIATEELAQAYAGSHTTLFQKAAKRIDMTDVDAAVAATEVDPSIYTLVGSYVGPRMRFYTIVSAATGETEVASISTTVRRALQRWKQTKYETADDAVKGMIDALQPDSPQQREFYRRFIESGWEWD